MWLPNLPKLKKIGQTDNRPIPYYILVRLLSNLIEEGTVQCIVEKLDLVTGNTAGQDGDTLVMR